MAQPGHAELSLNVTHSHELVLYAFARRCELGLDVEHLRRDARCAGDRAQALYPERNRIAPTTIRFVAALEQGFFRLWTRKEAVIKAVGTGLSTPLEDFDVSSAAGEPGSWFRVEVPAPNASTWLVRDLPIDDGYCAALAVARESSSIRYWTT